ncbi:MAG: GGDEF domain-containing protein [Chloroflexi bacterium]|nr:GGDEF domain-containing protein [Chloroflexota bacterium]
MKTELIFILVSGALAALVGLGALVAVLRGWGERHPIPGSAPTARDDTVSGTPLMTPSHDAVVRVVWWVAIAGVLVGIGISNAFATNRAAIYALGGAAVVIVVVLHEMLPRRLRGRATVAVEVVAALALSAGLVWLTGGADSPFVFTFHLLVVAAALTMGSQLALLVTAAASLAYLGQLLLDLGVPATSVDLLRVAINLGSLWLLAYLAGVYASSERRVRARVLELSQTDPLTSLFNRGQLFPTLEQEVQRTRRSGRGFCVLMIDLDGLKAINDSLGHLRGDDVLRAVGRVINGSIRTVDSAYRYGGDEFLILLPETEFIGAYVVAEKIREGVEEIGESVATDLAATSVSIGLVSHPEDGASPEELMVAADRAMYQAKALGKNQISGNPRPRRAPQRLLGPPGMVVDPPPADVSPPQPSRAAPVAPAAPTAATDAPPRSTATAFSVEPTKTNGSNHEAHGEDEPDPADVRRQIAAARRNMDPDHQIRRAMDAFLSSPTSSRADREQGS